MRANAESEKESCSIERPGTESRINQFERTYFMFHEQVDRQSDGSNCRSDLQDDRISVVARNDPRIV